MNVVFDIRQHDKAGMTFYEGDDIEVFRALTQVTFPVTWNGSELPPVLDTTIS